MDPRFARAAPRGSNPEVCYQLQIRPGPRAHCCRSGSAQTSGRPGPLREGPPRRPERSSDRRPALRRRRGDCSAHSARGGDPPLRLEGYGRAAHSLRRSCAWLPWGPESRVSQSRQKACAKFISSWLASTGHSGPPRPLIAPVTPPATNATLPRKSGLGKGVAGGGAAVVALARSPRRPRLINCAPRARRRARFGEERAPTTGDDEPTNGRPAGGRLPRVSREGTACRRRRRRRGRRSA